MKKYLFLAVMVLMVSILAFPVFAASMSSGPDAASTSQDVEKAASSGMSATLTGYLVDQICAKRGVGFDGSDLIHHPETHTLRCLKMQICIASGYGIYVKADKNTWLFYKFDKAGSDLALNNIVNKTSKPDHNLVAVTGKVKDGTIMVEKIIEL